MPQVRSWIDDCTTAGLSCVAFTSVYVFLRHRVFPSMTAGFANRMTSLAHALLMLPISASVISFRRPWSETFGTITTDAQAACLSVTLGYFVYDTIGVFLIEHDWGNTVHHLASMLAISVGIFGRRSGSELAWSLFLMEISNPLLHLQSYYSETGQSGTTAANVVNVLFALSFLGCRVVIGPILAYTAFVCPTSHIVVKAGGLGVQTMSFIWAFHLLQVASSRLGKPLTAKDGKEPVSYEAPTMTNQKS